MTPSDIMKGLELKNRALTSHNDEYISLVEDQAQKERTYNMAVAENTTKLLLDGEKVTVVKILVDGDRAISKLKMEWQVSVGVTKANQKSIAILISQIDTYRSLLSWLKAELGRS